MILDLETLKKEETTLLKKLISNRKMQTKTAGETKFILILPGDMAKWLDQTSLKYNMHKSEIVRAAILEAINKY